MNDAPAPSTQFDSLSFFERHIIFSYLLTKLLPIFFLLLSILIKFDSSFGFCICFIFLCLDFYFVKNYFGMSLIGLSFSFGPNGNEESTGIIQYYAKPAPYIPQSNLSNTFWIGSFISIGSFAFLFLICLFGGMFIYVLFCFLEIITQMLLLYFFISAQQMKRNETKEIVRNPYIENDEFQLVAVQIEDEYQKS